MRPSADEGIGARRRRRWALVACAAPLLALQCLAVPCHAGEAPAPPEAIGGAIERILRDDRYQTELPGGAGAPGRASPAGEDPAQSRPSEHRPDRRRPDREIPDVPSRVGELARAMLWLAIIVTATIAGAWLWATFLDPSRRSWGQAERAAPRRPVAPASPGERGLGDADTLAADGRFAEAIHVLLLSTIEDLRRRAEPAVSDSLTSREILASLAMPEDARAALADLVRAVELTHFGGRRPAGTHYAQCRERYARFAAAYGARR